MEEEKRSKKCGILEQAPACLILSRGWVEGACRAANHVAFRHMHPCEPARSQVYWLRLAQPRLRVLSGVEELFLKQHTRLGGIEVKRVLII